MVLRSILLLLIPINTLTKKTQSYNVYILLGPWLKNPCLSAAIIDNIML
jgi:hypothetical protein